MSAYGNHDISIGEMIDADDEARIVLLGRDPEIQFIRLAAEFNRQKEAIRDAVNVLCDGQRGTERTLDALRILRSANPKGQGAE